MLLRGFIATAVCVVGIGPASGQLNTAPVRQDANDNRVIRDPGIPSSYRGTAPERGQALQRASMLRLSKPSTEYQLGAGDVIKIEIVGNESLSEPLQNLVISTSGDIAVPLVGTLKAEGLTPSELEDAIQKSLKERQLIRDPEALVYILDYQAKPIFLLGEVDNPGEYVMSQQMTITEALLMAGGMEQTGALDLVSARYGYLHRRTSDGGGPLNPEALVISPEVARPGAEAIRVDLEPMRTGGLASPDIPLKKGDVFVVPRRAVEQIYIIGELRSPGPYEIPGPDSRSFQLTQAVARAGGPNPTAKLSKGMVLRQDRMGKRIEIKFDFSAVLRGRQPDFALQSNDIVFIPGSKIKTLQYGLLGIVPTAAQTRARTVAQSRSQQ